MTTDMCHRRDEEVGSPGAKEPSLEKKGERRKRNGVPTLQISGTSSDRYISAAMHYGSIPFDLPHREYSRFVMRNIEFVIEYFGTQGHPVYIFDHSMANNYLQMIDERIDEMPIIQKYLTGRIASNPFFGHETKHASINFLDNVILKSKISKADAIVFKTARNVIPLQSKNVTRGIGIWLSEWLIKKNNRVNERIWKAIKQRLLIMASDLDALPALNRIPLEHTLNRLPIKIFAIQIQSALRVSKRYDDQRKLDGFARCDIPVLILTSKNDPIARFEPNFYTETDKLAILDITNPQETELFREHLYYMIHPQTTISIIEQFIQSVESKQSSISNVKSWFRELSQ